jgi:hypothetical protein
LKKKKYYKQGYIGINFDKKLQEIELASGPKLDKNTEEEFCIYIKNNKNKFNSRVLHEDNRYSYKNSKKNIEFIVPSAFFFKKERAKVLITKNKKQIYVEIKKTLPQ